MGELSINGIYNRDDNVYSNPSERKSDSAITIDFSGGVQPSNKSTPIYTLMGCGFNYEKSLKNPNQEFDANGRLVKQNFGPYRVEYEYDENGNKTKETKTYLPDHEGAAYKEIILFDKEGKESKIYYGNLFPGQNDKELIEGTVQAEYDTEGNLLRRTITPKDKKYLSLAQRTYYYDKQGYMIRGESKNCVSNLTYDSTGLIKEDRYSRKAENIYGDNGKILLTHPAYNGNIKYNYNNQNQLVSIVETTKENNGKIDKFTTKYEYNTNGQPSVIKEFVNGKSDGKCVVSYDENDKIQGMKLYDEKNVPYVTYEYKNGKFFREKDLY